MPLVDGASEITTTATQQQRRKEEYPLSGTMKNSVARKQPEKVYQHIPQTDNLPLAIGANFHDDPINRSTLRKSHNLLLARQADGAPHTEYCYTGLGCTSRSRSGGKTTASDDEDEAAEVWEGWFSQEVTKADESSFVARILAYFCESVPESPSEEERIRKVCIKCFLQDNSISIQEAKEENSGIVQSTLLSRQQVPKDHKNPDEVISLDDFEIGGTVEIYGRVYTITDMDKRTRNFFHSVRHQELPPAVPIPEDRYSVTAKSALIKSASRAVTSDDMDWRRVAEQQLTGIYTKHQTEDIAIAQQFLKNRINEHLTFFALWDDRGNISGDLHYCVLRLFLDNFAIEIAEQKPENSGRAGGPILLSRQRIPVPGVDVSKSRHQEHTYGKLMKNDYLGPQDIEVGKTYTIFGKPFFVFDSDPFTRDYVRREYGVELSPAVDITPFVRTEEKPALFFPPPPNGFGSERENRSNWLSLSGRATARDQMKAQQESGRVMTFAACLAKPLVKGDEGRLFAISFYRETDEVEVLEKPERNSGFMGGRFLTKGKHLKELPDGTSRPFAPSDFVVGEEVVLYQRAFKLLAMGGATKGIVAGTDKSLTEDRVKGLLLLLKQQIALKYQRINEAYRALAPGGTLGYKQIQQFLLSCSCPVTEEEAMLVVQNFAPKSDGVVTFDVFLQVMNVAAESMDEASLTTRSVRSVSMNVDTSVKDTACSAENVQRRRYLRGLLQQKLIQGKGSVQEQFRVLGEHSPSSRLSREAFRRSLNRVMHFNMSEDDEEMLVSLLFDGSEDENDTISYKQFQEFVDSVDGN